jgi:site-specific DNA-methyltransferase (adenine-specific)
MPDLATNVLYYGDNLAILRRYLPDAAVDLVYLDPPCNSNRDDNVTFRDESGKTCDAQLLAFEDTWHWGPSAESGSTSGRPILPSCLSSLGFV